MPAEEHQPDLSERRVQIGGELGGRDAANTNLDTNLITGGGDIAVIDPGLEGHVTTGGGTVRFARVRGSLRGTSGSSSHVLVID
jgi:hypothetical protein